MSSYEKRPHIPMKVQKHLWLRAGGRCEFRGCNKILYEDDVTQDPINGSNIAHIISWTPNGPRGSAELSHKLSTDINNLMLTCPRHNNLIDSSEYVNKYTVSILREMKQEHEDAIRRITDLNQKDPVTIIELRSLIHGRTPSISAEEEADALFPYYPAHEKIIVDLCDIEDIDTAKAIIDSKVKKVFTNDKSNRLYAAFIMALIPYGCYLGYALGNTIPVTTYQHFRDTEDWRWRETNEEDDYSITYPNETKEVTDVNLFINISGQIDRKLVKQDFPIYLIETAHPGFESLQSWYQVLNFRVHYREMLTHIRQIHGENVIIHLYCATPNPINFELGKGIMKNLDPTIILYDKTEKSIYYEKVMTLHSRFRE